MSKAYNYCPRCGSYRTQLLELCLVEPFFCATCGNTFAPEVVSDGLLCSQLPEYNGWRPYYEYPGYVHYARPTSGLVISACSDFNGEELLDIQAQSDDGSWCDDGRGMFSGGGLLPWPKLGRTSATMFELIKPFLDEYQDATYRHPCKRCGVMLINEIEDVCATPGEGCCP